MEENYTEEFEKSLEPILSDLNLADDKILAGELKDAVELLSESYKKDLDQRKVYSITARSQNNAIRDVKNQMNTIQTGINEWSTNMNGYKDVMREDFFDLSKKYKHRIEKTQEESVEHLKSQIGDTTNSLLKPIKYVSYGIYGCTAVNLLLTLVNLFT